MKAVRKEIMPFVNLTYIQTEKFKTSALSLNLLLPLRAETAPKNALVLKVLYRGTAQYPNIDLIAKKKDEMYGASVGYNNRKRGECQCIGFSAEFIDDKYIPGGEKLLEEVSTFLGEMLCSPVLENGLLKAEYVESEKKNLIRGIRSKINNKAGYAVSRLTELMCAGENYASDQVGTEAEAEKINNVNLTEHYKKILATAPIEVFYCGAAGIEGVEAALHSALKDLPRKEPNWEIKTEVRMDAEEVRYYNEEMNVNQGVLAMGFRLGKCMENLDRPALTMFNGIFGGGTQSKLFLNVREKLSLCYNIGSGTDHYKGIMMVSSGIEFDKYQKVLDEVMAQLDNMKNGKIEDWELDTVKSNMKTGLRAMRDSAGQLAEFYLGEAIDGRLEGPEELLAQVDGVDKVRIQKIAQSIQADLIYFLKGIEGRQGE